MGHGVCDVHNKSTPISGPTGAATDDGNRIASAIVKIYESQKFDAKELRGIGIQVQKLESRNNVEERAPGQGVLAFAAKANPIRMAPEPVDLTMDSSPVIAGPATRSKVQVKPKPEPVSRPLVRKTKATFKAVEILPSDIDLGVWASMDTAMQDEYRGGWRMAGIKIPGAFERSRQPQASVSPSKARHAHEGRSREPSLNPLITSKTDVNKILTALNLVEGDLAAIGISLEAFVALDSETRNDLAHDISRKKSLFRRGSETPTRSPHKVAPHRDIAVSLPRRPTIRMGSSEPQQDVDSVLDGLTAWMDVAAEREPNPREVKVLRKYIRRCLDPASSSLGGLQDADRVLTWWERLCKQKWSAGQDEIANKWSACLADARREMNEILGTRFAVKLGRKRF